MTKTKIIVIKDDSGECYKVTVTKVEMNIKSL